MALIFIKSTERGYTVEAVKVFCDGGSRAYVKNRGGFAALGVYVENDPLTSKPIRANGFLGKKTNNYAEYSSLIYALRLIRDKGWKNTHIQMDSLLVVNQFNGIYQIKNVTLAKLYDQAQYYAKQIRENGQKITLSHIPREKNTKADKLVNEAIDKALADGCAEDPLFV